MPRQDPAHRRRSRSALLLMLALLSLAIHPHAALAEQGDPKEAESQSTDREQARQLYRQAAQLHAQGKFEDAAELYVKFIALMPDYASGHYNYACALARLGKQQAALKSLGDAIDKGFTNATHMAADPDLASLHGNKQFDALVDKAWALQVKTLPKADAPAKHEGVRSEDRLPRLGLAYRLYVSDKATHDKPHRLIIWMHPSGGSMNKVIERLPPHLAKLNFALLVPTRKQWRGWMDTEIKALMGATLEDAATIKTIDARQPIFLGFSAGGQAALNIWNAAPQRVGGLVLDAAYPLDMAAYAKRQTKLMTLPRHEAVKGTPVFALIGEKDGNGGAVRLWEKAKAEWAKEHVPVTLVTVPDAGHQWLLGKAQFAELSKWLEALPDRKDAAADAKKDTKNNGDSNDNAKPAERATPEK